MRQRGFSLLEVLVAVTIIGIGFSVVFAAMSGSIKGLGRAEANDRRVELARTKLAELDLIKKIRLQDSASGKFPDGSSWTLQSSLFIPPVLEGPRPNAASIIRIDLTLEWMGRNGLQRQVIETYRYQLADSTPIPALEEQIRALQ